MKSNKAGFNSVDEYIATFPEATQRALEEVRSSIKSVAPEAKEKISYQIAAFELNGKDLVYFAGWKNHISIYPVPAGDPVFRKAIAPHMDGKGTLKFLLDKPLPLELIREVVQLHVTDNRKKVEMSLRGGG